MSNSTPPESPPGNTGTESTLQPPADSSPPRLSTLQMLGSALAAAVGVQSSKNRVRDFEQGKASHFIAVGIVFTIVFVLGMIMLVRLVLNAATP